MSVLTATRIERAAMALSLREAGLTRAEIKETMGLSRSYVYSLFDDPDGSKERARKDGYRLPCPSCGNLMDGSNGLTNGPRLCLTCTMRANHDNRFWTRERCITAFGEFARRMGRNPSVPDSMCRNGGSPSLSRRLSAERLAEIAAIPDDLSLPPCATVTREFGSWSAGLRAAGMNPGKGGSSSHRNERRTMRRFVVLEKIGGGDWRANEPVEAVTAELAISLVAQSAGTYVVVPAALWAEREVAARTMFAVVGDA